MKLRTILTLTTLFLACFTFAVFSEAAGETTLASHASENQSVSGKIITVGDAMFSMSVAGENQKAQTVQFFVDGKTRMEGKLSVGAQAMVEYRSENGQNIAVHVVVTPSSGENR